MNRVLMFALFMLGTLVVSAAGVSGQGAAGLASQCVSGGGVSRDWCEEVAIGAQALRAGVGFAAAAGSDVPGSASTLGTKLAGLPRVSLSLRPSLGRIKGPRVIGAARSGVDGQSLWVPTVQGSVVVSVMNGFSVVPSVGGIFALDVLGTVGYVSLPEEFGDNTVTVGVGARLGILRESFTMPGLSVSVVHRGLGDATYGGGPTDDAEISFDVSTTSVRAIVGKDLPLIGFFAGVGRDWHRGDISVRAMSAGGANSTAADSFTDRRTVYFGGTSWSFLILQASIEVGWSSGFDDIAGRTGEFSTSSHPFFASTALRVTL